jgi:murein DD-endopeptidase MepM/ murein hydrolase activator NlpD
MTRHPDPLFNLADALSEDIVAAPADALLHEAESDPGGRAGLVASFDRIAARAVAQSRRRRLAERLRGLLQAWPIPVGLTSAMAGVTGLLVAGIVGGTYFYQAPLYRQAAAVPPPQVFAERTPAKTYEPGINGPMSYSDTAGARFDQSDRRARSDSAAAPPTPAAASPAPPPAPTAAPPVATLAPPPAPPVAAGAADEPKPVRTVEIHPGMAATPVARSARRSQPRAEDRVAALVAVAEQKRLTPAPVSQPAAALAPEAPKAPSRPALAALAGPDSPGFRWPARGRVIAGFGAEVGGAPNNGIDLAVPAGTDVLAADEGVVLYAGNEIKSLGNLVLLRHRDDFVTAYAHAKSIQVKVGDTVRRGQVIAKSGQTGTVKAPQLHFEIRKDNAPVDPAQFLPPG